MGRGDGARQAGRTEAFTGDPADGAAAQVWVGANYWSRAGGPRMWSRYDGAVVRTELAVLAAHGLNVTRSFCFWPDFVPEPGRLDPDVLDRFADFLDAHVENGLGTVPTFLVGHMSGENWDPPWRGGRDLQRDVWLVAQQAWFAGELARRFRRHPAIAGWIVSNEMPLYAGPAAAAEVEAWARLVLQAVRAAGAAHPVSLGDGAWGVETTGTDNGYSLRALAPLVDFVGPHVYPMEDDEARLALAAAFACELCDGFGRPVVLEEFGVSSDFGADDAAAAYYRQVLHTTLLAGTRGWLAWNNTDLDELRAEDPYRHHVFELHFGLTDRAGRPKPQLRELSRFAGLVRRLAVRGWEPVKGAAALVVPEHFERELPFTEPAFRQDIRAALLQAYVAAREADLPIAVTRERDGLPGTARLLLAPSTKLLTSGGLERLRERAKNGATVYFSYFAGSTSNQRGPWLTGLDELFGVRHRLRHGLVDPIEGEEVTLEFVEPFGDIAAATRLSFAVGGTSSARAHLPVDPVGARIVAVDGRGRPALLRHALGGGSTILCTYPLEHMAAQTARVNPESTWRLYSALAVEADVPRPVRVHDPRVAAGLVRSGGVDTAVAVNLSGDSVTAQLEAGDGEHEPSLTLEPGGVAVFDLSSRRDPAPRGREVACVGEGRDART